MSLPLLILVSVWALYYKTPTLKGVVLIQNIGRFFNPVQCLLKNGPTPASFLFFQTKNLQKKTVGISRIRTRIVRVEGKHADHLTTTTAHYPMHSFYPILFVSLFSLILSFQSCIRIVVNLLFILNTIIIIIWLCFSISQILVAVSSLKQNIPFASQF